MSRYNKDLTYFKSVDTPSKAYTLGLIYSDGCITQGNVLSIQMKDKECIEWIKQELKYDGPIKIVKGQNSLNTIMYTLRISCKEIYNDLLVLGVTPRKSKSIRFPILNSAELKDAFICGIFDGDGSIHVNAHKIQGRRITIAGSQYMIASIKDYLHTEHGFPNITTKIEKCGTYVLQYVTSRVNLFWNRLYSKSPFRMYRKEFLFKLDNDIVQSLGKPK